MIDKEEFLESSDLFLRGRPARIILVVGGKLLYTLMLWVVVHIDVGH